MTDTQGDPVYTAPSVVRKEKRVAQGSGREGDFAARVLAKHDENTRPEAAYAVEQAQKARKTLQ